MRAAASAKDKPKSWLISSYVTWAAASLAALFRLAFAAPDTPPRFTRFILRVSTGLVSVQTPVFRTGVPAGCGRADRKAGVGGGLAVKGMSIRIDSQPVKFPVKCRLISRESPIPC